ncbi:MAG: hypothetical protein DLM67_00430 [Candidatus Nephthysia bennettiae]|uniref:Uncharacterized protein n=1 Tax=Candidatus Nephthysia bennettiae TaxID=3127016 RepID=A0A934K4K9_9BACT|nr:hypothetical protein [Candidatus Dormibacteraeota bacterium]MBJ7612777.1 hypothetical protein [Candidatus Dormibacteraeota bacterium]PZS00792.1 MAG: hypothetical protein DLM67_00430 [Candidatus Dormibacteraeota bacterium]
MTTEDEATYSYAEKAGAWDIGLDPSDSTTVSALNEAADHATGAFVDAFAEIGTLEYAEGTLTEIADDGRILSVRSEIPLVEQDGRFRPAPDAQPAVLTERAVLSSAILTYTVTVRQTDAENNSKTLTGGLFFYYDSGLSGLVGQPAASDGAFARVDVEVDPWLDTPIHGGKFLDNRTIAALNRPRLENALRRWETATGKPIDHQTSVPYPALVDRYGFRAGGEPDPP